MKMLINGKQTAASDGKTLEVLNPATMELIDTVPSATQQDVEAALDAAQQGKKQWRDVVLFERVDILRKFISLIDKNLDVFAKMISAESGKTLVSCIDEAKACMGIFESYCEKAKNYGGETLPFNSEARVKGDIIFTLREPLGVVACVVPFNYPVELYAHKVAPALVMGNAVIIKPSSDTPMCNIFLTQLLLEAGVPGAAAQIVTGSGARIGKQIAESPKIDAISLTGSTSVGIETMQNGAKNLTHVFLELGGNDPLIVFEGTDLDQAVTETLAGRASNAGQTCCGTKRLIIQNSIKEAYTQKLLEALKGLKIGDPLDPDTVYGPLISERAAKDVEQQVQKTIEQGATCLYGGKRYDTTYFEPTLLTDVTMDMDVAGEMEIFGPVFPVIGFDTVEQAIEIANHAPYGLSSGVMSPDICIALKVATEIEAGTCVINGCGNYRSAHLAFGGYKMTGIGREGITHTLDEYTQTKNIALKQLLK
ncbi:MAG: aldehyde dehydrogenase family protein [Christensenella sp.]|uniref:aldehyde dehydrogenase family protein n=1 Tax=Christensenella sp. TaxID=1935934 RepID=UPI002B218299|nr:aldehyde dehydrogenase family protein [Christensenella sp.]MEA5002339.1 aldehyde dehydrogenase family protein [Christensenella sp.]